MCLLESTKLDLVIVVCQLVIRFYYGSVCVNCAIEVTKADFNLCISQENRTHDRQSIFNDFVHPDQDLLLIPPNNGLTALNSKESNLKIICRDNVYCLPWTYCNTNSSLCECAYRHAWYGIM